MSLLKLTKHKVKIAILGLALLVACATSPLGRRQLIFVPDATMNQMGAQAFSQIKAQEPIERNRKIQSYVDCIVDPITQAAEKQTHIRNWEVVVFRNNQANAFALPGGRIGVYTGLLKVAKSDAQLAAVIGHEVGHVVARHGAERVSEQAGTQLGLQALGVLTQGNPNRRLILGLLGLGARFGILLPFSRTQESEADLIGLRLMSEAGFDPEQSVQLWKNMIAASGGSAPPQWLSTHPASETRIAQLEENMPQALTLFHRALAEGHRPVCDRSLLGTLP